MGKNKVRGGDRIMEFISISNSLALNRMLTSGHNWPKACATTNEVRDWKNSLIALVRMRPHLLPGLWMNAIKAMLVVRL